MIKTVLSAESNLVNLHQTNVASKYSCFELFGFDILLDSKLKPWLLEVNMSPSLNTESAIDARIKTAMLCDLFTLVGVPAVDPALRRAQFEQQLRDISAGRGGGGGGHRASRSAEDRRNAAIRDGVYISNHC